MFGIGPAEMLIIALIIGFLFLLMAIPATLAYVILNRIPESHRKQSPGLCFLMLIPIFSLVWQFFVYPKISESFKSYFATHPNPPQGDFGAGIALWCCVSAILSFVPVLGVFAGLASLILLIIFFVKAFELTKLIQK
jgi:hypothetical protein